MPRHITEASIDTISVEKFGAVGDGIADDTKAIQMALNLSLSEGSVKVYIPKGVYKITTRLVVYRNTHLVLHNDATILRGSYVSMLTNADSEVNPLLDNNDPYSGHGNIIIEGGTWDGNLLNQPYANTGFNGFGFTRGRSITIRDVTIKDIATCHAIDMSAMDHVLIENCTFLGYKDATVSGDAWYPRDYPEAIQIDTFKENLVGKEYANGVPCKNIVVRDCYFGASGTEGTQAWATGVGNHSATHNSYVQNIKIVNNTFDGMTYAGVHNMKFKDCYVLGNKFINCKIDVFCNNVHGSGEESSKYWDPNTNTWVQSDLPQSGSNFIVSDNIFEGTKNRCVLVNGQSNGENIAKFKGVVISNNIMKKDIGTYTGDNAFYLVWVDDAKVTNNTVQGGKRGLQITYSSNVIVTNNLVTNTQLEGIWITDFDDSYRGLDHTNTISIQNNVLRDIPYTGILASYCSRLFIRNNYLNSVATQDDNIRSGINLSAGCKNSEIGGNTVVTGSANQNKYGVYVSSTNSKIRVGANNLSGKTGPISISGTDNFSGEYLYSTDGSRYRLTLDNTGAILSTKD